LSGRLDFHEKIRIYSGFGVIGASVRMWSEFDIESTNFWKSCAAGSNRPAEASGIRR
jgi:hypothetical protein